MKQIRRRLTYANVVSSLAVFLVLGGATAIAANQLGKKTVGTKQLKSNAVTTAKLKKNAVTTVKIKDGAVIGTKLAANAVTGDKIADGTVTGADLNPGSTPFSQIVARVRGTATVPATSGTVYPLANPAYTQAAGEDDQFMGAVDVNFAASCTQPRAATIFLLLDAANPTAPTINDLVGYGTVEDKGAGSVTRQVQLGNFPGAGASGRFAPSNPTSHTFTVLFSSSSCSSGSGISATGAGIDVIGTK